MFNPVRLIKNFISVLRSHPRRFLTLMYFPVYLVLFAILERHSFASPHRIHTPLDNYIPFVEIFIIPYCMWFGYLFYGFYVLYKKTDGLSFYRLAMSVFIGLAVFILISVIYPNAQDLRPDPVPRHNIFTFLCGIIWSIDPAENLLPSVHVYTSIAVHHALISDPEYGNRPRAPYVSAILMSLIVASTMFIKQHSTLDVILAILLFLAAYPFIYGRRSEGFEHRVEVAHERFDENHRPRHLF